MKHNDKITNIEKLENFVEQLTHKWKHGSGLSHLNYNLPSKQKLHNISNQQPTSSLFKGLNTSDLQNLSPDREKQLIKNLAKEGLTPEEAHMYLDSAKAARSKVEHKYMQILIEKVKLSPEEAKSALHCSKVVTNFYQMISLYNIKKWNLWNIILSFKNNPEAFNYLRIINHDLFKNTQPQIESIKKGEEIAKKYFENDNGFLAYYRTKAKDADNSINILSIHNLNENKPIKISDVLQQEREVDKLKLYHQEKIQMVACVEDNGIRNYKFKEGANYKMTINWPADEGNVKMVIKTGDKDGISELVSFTLNGKEIMNCEECSIEKAIELAEKNTKVHINSSSISDCLSYYLEFAIKPSETLKEVRQKKQRNFSSNKECTDSLFNYPVKTVKEEQETNLPWSRDDSTNYILSLLDQLNLPNQDKSTVITGGDMQKSCENTPKLEIDHTQKQKFSQNTLRERQNQKDSSFPVKKVRGEQKKAFNDRQHPNDQSKDNSWVNKSRRYHKQKNKDKPAILRG